MAGLVPAERAYQEAVRLGLRLSRAEVFAILMAAADRPGLSETDAALTRAAWLTEQLTVAADEWARAADADEAPEQGAVAYGAAADLVREMLRQVSASAPVDHLAEIERHLAALKAELRAPLPQRHPLLTGPLRELRLAEKARQNPEDAHG